MRHFVSAETAAPAAGTPPAPLSPSADRIPDRGDCDGLGGGGRSGCRAVQLGAAEPLPLLAVAGHKKHQRALRPSG